jgi:thiamine kinase-like enzyme
MPKSPNWLFETFDYWYEKAYKEAPIDELIKELKLITLQKYDLKLEIEWLKKCILTLNSPVVFSHNDLYGNNIMVREDNSINKLTICDFEFASYIYRGYDLGFLFTFWDRKKFIEDIPFPSDKIIKEFLSIYLDECVKLHGKEYLNDTRNTISHLMSELKVFILTFFMMYLTCCLQINSDHKNMRKSSLMVSFI